MVSEEGDLRNVERGNLFFLCSLCFRSILTVGTQSVNHARTYRQSLDRTEEVGYSGTHLGKAGNHKVGVSPGYSARPHVNKTKQGVGGV